MRSYDHRKIEKKWQSAWKKKKLFRAAAASKRKKYYCLIEFPYPSGDGLHVGHIRSNTAMDVIARKRRAEGFDVLYPIGWDAFGLPTENYAIKTGIHPRIVTKRNTDNFRRQLTGLGFSFDWSREINTSDPNYYRWTQWIFLQFWKRGLAYKKKMAINWCPKDLIGLANEEVVDGCCERCGTPVERREREQWMLAITKYADRLVADLDSVDYLERIKIQQRNWIGKSEGLLFTAPIKGTPLVIRTFSAHYEAFYADSFVVIAPDHPFLPRLLKGLPNEKETLKGAEEMLARRISQKRGDGEPEGIFTGRYIADPVGNGDLPIWIASYAIAEYGTGIVKASAHDERDFAFAKKYGIPLKAVLFPTDPARRAKVGRFEECYTDMKNGILSEPSEFAGKRAGAERERVAEYAIKKGFATRTVIYRLRDWIFSRQRYWGEPIPLIFCEKCGWVAVPEKDLPIKLPNVRDFKPRENGESPLAGAVRWVNVKCPTCKGAARRETDVMPNWAGSSWYYLAYLVKKAKRYNLKAKNPLRHWLPVDWYNGGMEHTTLHLLYSRFWHKFLFDLGLVPTSEPYAKRTSHGLILAEGGVKMSKSKGNVINPDELVARFGADSVRLYEMFMGPFDQAITWNTDGIVGTRRFLEKVWRAATKVSEAHETPKALQTLLHQTIKKVSEDIEAMKFNTAVSQLMICANEFEKVPAVPRASYEIFLKLLAPFAPHIAEELWRDLGHARSISVEPWPAFDAGELRSGSLSLVVQIDGKVRASFPAEPSLAEDEALRRALRVPEAAKWTAGREIRLAKYIPGRLVSIVTRPSSSWR